MPFTGALAYLGAVHQSIREQTLLSSVKETECFSDAWVWLKETKRDKREEKYSSLRFDVSDVLIDPSSGSLNDATKVRVSVRHHSLEKRLLVGTAW
jgi:hypothetical protein